jgi:photosystem II stability/assembly factor-like uncharacterized protein
LPPPNRKRKRKQGKKRPKKLKVTKSNKKKLLRLPMDDPRQRNQASRKDISVSSGEEFPGELRLLALERASGELNVGVPPIPGGSNWIQMGPTAIPDGQTISTYYDKPNIPALVTGRITAIVIDTANPNIIYIGTGLGGIWKTTDGGRNWSPTSDYEKSLAIGALIMDPKDHDILYAGTGEGNFAQDSYYGNGLIKTTDGGKTWKRYGKDEFKLARFCRLAINHEKNQTVFAAINSSEHPQKVVPGLYRSTDGGENWHRMTNFNPPPQRGGATDIILDPINPNIAYAAIWGNGVYRTSNSNEDNPLWTKLNIPDNRPGRINRISLGISKSSPQTIYALMARDRPIDRNDSENGGEVFQNSDGRLWQSDVIDSFYQSTDGGTTWKRIELPGKGTLSDVWCKDSIGTQGFYNLNVAVDPTTPDIVYLGGVSLWKAIRTPSTNSWNIKDIGITIHPDHHAFAFDPTNSSIIYAGNDGGIYKSKDAGESWIDTINEGPCITQFEFMAIHPWSDAVVVAGTQDNGTVQFRNNSVFYHMDVGDGGFISIDPLEPNNTIHQRIFSYLFHSKNAGKKDSWHYIGTPLENYSSAFYAPFTLDQSNPKNIAFGGMESSNGTSGGISGVIALDTNQGLNRWRKSPIKIPGLLDGEEISAINYVNSNLIYVGTSKAKVFSLTNVNEQWIVKAIHNSPLPNISNGRDIRIWDVATHPKDIKKVFVVNAGFGSKEEPLSHVWAGEILPDGTAKWKDINPRNDNDELIDIPVNAIVIDEDQADTMYIGTDIGVFRTINGGQKWTPFSEGLPNTAVYDMRLRYTPAKILRAVTHGRGIWERRLDVQTLPDVDIYVRHHIMDTGRFASSSSSAVNAAFEDEFQNISFGEPLSWWMCADIKIDSLKESENELQYQMREPDSVDYVKFERQLHHTNSIRGRVNRVYVQIHNRGIKSVEKDVKVKLFYAYADSSTGYPDLPSDFWTAFPQNSQDTSNWKPIGGVQVLPSAPKTLTNTEPTILYWEWSTPQDAPDKACILVVIDSIEDPITGTNKIFNIERLLSIEKHVGLKDIHVTML